MKVQYELSAYSLRAEVVSEENPRLSVSVSRGKKYGEDEWGRAEINWSAYGSVKHEDAAEYAKLLKRAVRIAEQFELSVIMKYKVTVTIQNEDGSIREHEFIAVAVCEDHVRQHCIDKLAQNPALKGFEIQLIGQA